MVLKDIFTVGSADMTHAFLKLFFSKIFKTFFEDFETGIRQQFESKCFVKI